MMKITHRVVINCKPEQVFPWIAEPEKAMRWQKNVRGGKIITETKDKIGTTFKEELAENGKSLVMYGEITNYVQDKLISFHLESKIHKFDVDYLIVGDRKKSTFTIQATIHWKFPMNIVSLIIGQKIRAGVLQQTKSELAELKKLCETRHDDH